MYTFLPKITSSDSKNEIDPRMCMSCDTNLSIINDQPGCVSNCDDNCQGACHLTCVAACVDVCRSNCTNFCHTLIMFN